MRGGSTRYGHAPLGRFYDALWAGRTSEDWIEDPRSALRTAELDEDLAAAGESETYDAALRASHEEAVGLLDQEAGTPILAVTTPEGLRHAMFGPVLSHPPEDADAIRLWDGVLQLSGVAAFTELKC